jgi:cyanate lyase
MTKEEMTDIIVSTKKAKGLTWQAIAEAVGMAKEWVTSACLGMNKMNADQANKLCAFLGLDDEVGAALQDFPYKTWDAVIPQDPVVYRLYEIVGVYGDTIKEIIHEMFGDGIMSAIDFSMDIQKKENPKGDRVVVTLNGKFLPYTPW